MFIITPKHQPFQLRSGPAIVSCDPDRAFLRLRLGAPKIRSGSRSQGRRRRSRISRIIISSRSRKSRSSRSTSRKSRWARKTPRTFRALSYCYRFLGLEGSVLVVVTFCLPHTDTHLYYHPQCYKHKTHMHTDTGDVGVHISKISLQCGHQFCVFPAKLYSCAKCFCEARPVAYTPCAFWQRCLSAFALAANTYQNSMDWGL